MADPGDFYIGWQPRAGRGIARFLAPVLGGLVGGGLLIGVSLAATQVTFGPARFDFGSPRQAEGTLVLWPTAVLLEDRPGEASAGAVSAVWLVGEGKWGVGDDVRALEGHRVRLMGTPIYRGDQTMLEVVGGSLEDLGPASTPAPVAEDLGVQTLIGEIVDSKCFLGVMNPGNLKTHRACATRCISGGIPPLLLVRQEDGTARQILLVGANGEAVNQAILDRIAEPVRVTGRLQRRADRLILAADPSRIERLLDGP